MFARFRLLLLLFCYFSTQISASIIGIPSQCDYLTVNTWYCTVQHITLLCRLTNLTAKTSQCQKHRKSEKSKHRKTQKSNEGTKERSNESERTKERRNEGTKERRNEETNERTNEGTNESERRNEGTKERTKERTNERTNVVNDFSFLSFSFLSSQRPNISFSRTSTNHTLSHSPNNTYSRI